jgi:cell division protein FtsL
MMVWVYTALCVTLGLCIILLWVSVDGRIVRLDDKRASDRYEIDHLTQDCDQLRQAVWELQRKIGIMEIEGELGENCPKCNGPMRGADPGDYLCPVCRYGT